MQALQCLFLPITFQNHSNLQYILIKGSDSSWKQSILFHLQISIFSQICNNQSVTLNIAYECKELLHAAFVLINKSKKHFVYEFLNMLIWHIEIFKQLYKEVKIELGIVFCQWYKPIKTLYNW